MNDPRIEAVAAEIDADEPGEFLVMAHNLLNAADAADPLLPKVRALHHAVLDYLVASGYAAHAPVRRAFEKFTTDDLTRLGIISACPAS